jgi:yecA family protein
LEGPNGEVIVSDWAGGFLDAVALRAKAWKPLIKDRKGGIMMQPFFVLNGDAELLAGRDGAADEERFMAEAPDLISTCVLGIHEFWKERIP